MSKPLPKSIAIYPKSIAIPFMPFCLFSGYTPELVKFKGKGKGKGKEKERKGKGKGKERERNR